MKAQKNTKVVNAVRATVKPDSKIANDAGREQRMVVLSKLNTADDLLGTALVAALKMTAEFGPTSKDEVAQGYTRCNNPDVYASTFNKGAKVATIIGIAATLQLIDKAAGDGTGGAGYRKACDALGSVIAQAKIAGEKTLSPKVAKLAVAGALKVAADKSKGRKAKPVTVVRKRSEVAMAKASLESGRDHKAMAGYLKQASHAAHKLEAPEGREDAHKKALQLLALACEAWQVFAK